MQQEQQQEQHSHSIRRRPQSDHSLAQINTVVAHEQLQSEPLAPSVVAAISATNKPGLARFTRSLVEMYHTKQHSPIGADLLSTRARLKRQTLAAEPEDSSAMLVQSIKIVDRLALQAERDNNKLDTNHKLQPLKGSKPLAMVTVRNGLKSAHSNPSSTPVDNAHSTSVREPSNESIGNGSENSATLAMFRFSSLSVLLAIAILCFVCIQLLLVASFGLASRNTANQRQRRQTKQQLGSTALISTSRRQDGSAAIKTIGDDFRPTTPRLSAYEAASVGRSSSRSSATLSSMGGYLRATPPLKATTNRWLLLPTPTLTPSQLGGAGRAIGRRASGQLLGAASGVASVGLARAQQARGRHSSPMAMLAGGRQQLEWSGHEQQPQFGSSSQF